jgi:hypothetical protein
MTTAITCSLADICTTTLSVSTTNTSARHYTALAGEDFEANDQAKAQTSRRKSHHGHANQ